MVYATPHHLALVSMSDIPASSSHLHHSSMPSSKPVTKRARKAINCEPCRASKLKCDRARPCSSCILRGTVALCYQNDSRSDSDPRKHDISSSHFDPQQEIIRIRTALSLLEFHMGRNPVSNPRNFTRTIENEPYSSSGSSSVSPYGIIPATVAQLYTGDGGLYAGPTSAATFLTSFSDEDSNQHHEMVSLLSDNPRASPASNSSEPASVASVVGSRDLDMLAFLPDLSIVDGLVNFYFDCSNWENRYLDYVSFTSAWYKFKENPNSSNGDDRVFIATLFLVMAIATLYLPSRHQLIAPLNAHPNDLAENYYHHSCTVLQRYRTERHPYTLEFIELLLLHTHYLLVTKERCEDLWSYRGELVSLACAMGLHRDSSMWKLPREEAERRRWAWWNILLTDRWAAFLLGRPLGIPNHHFDTCMPGPLDPSVDPSQQVHLPLILMFRLVEILGEIMDDAVSVRPVPHERIMYHDKNLQEWYESFPEELTFDDYQMAKALASDVLSIRRAGLVSLCMRVTFFHIRFILHRPYAKSAKYAAAECNGQGGRGMTEAQFEVSLEIAINAADRVLHHAAQAKHDFIANKMLLVPGTLNWGLVHIFNAAMFFVNQILADPEQPGVNLFRGNVKRGIAPLEAMRGLPVSDKAFSILVSLAPVYEENPNYDLSEHQLEERENKKKRALSFVRRLPFPCFSNPAQAPAILPLPLTFSNNNNSSFTMQYPLASSASTSNFAGQNNNSNSNHPSNNNYRSRNNHSIGSDSSHGSTHEMYHSRNSTNIVSGRDRLPRSGYTHPSRSPPQDPATSIDGGLNRSAVKTPMLPPLSQPNPTTSPLPILNLQLSYQSQSQSHGLYPLSNEHAQNNSSSNSGTHTHVAASTANGHSLLNSYLMNGPPHNPASSHGQGARHYNVNGGGNNGENGAMWGTSMEVDSSWDGFLSVVPPTE